MGTAPSVELDELQVSDIIEIRINATAELVRTAPPQAQTHRRQVGSWRADQWDEDGLALTFEHVKPL